MVPQDRESVTGVDRGVVSTLASNHGVEAVNERRLRCCLVAVDDACERFLMPFECGFARRDERGETQPCGVPASRFSCVRFPYRELAHVEAQEVEPYVPVGGLQRVREAGFTRLEFQAEVT